MVKAISSQSSSIFFAMSGRVFVYVAVMGDMKSEPFYSVLTGNHAL